MIWRNDLNHSTSPNGWACAQSLASRFAERHRRRAQHSGGSPFLSIQNTHTHNPQQTGNIFVYVRNQNLDCKCSEIDLGNLLSIRRFSSDLFCCRGQPVSADNLIAPVAASSTLAWRTDFGRSSAVVRPLSGRFRRSFGSVHRKSRASSHGEHLGVLPVYATGHPGLHHGLRADHLRSGKLLSIELLKLCTDQLLN